MNDMSEIDILDGDGEESRAKALAIWGGALASQYGKTVYSWTTFRIKMAVNGQVGHPLFDKNTGQATGFGSFAKKARGGAVNSIAGLMDLEPCDRDGSFKPISKWGWLGGKK
jgi:hypothetical protein